MNNNTSQIINTERIGEVDFIQGRKGIYRAVVKCQAGFMTVVDDIGIQNNWGRQEWNSAIDVFRGFKKGALQTIQFKSEESTHWATVFARKGLKVQFMDIQLFTDMEVGDINQNWSNSNLYSQRNYQAAGAKNWSHKAFVLNNLKAA